MNDLNVFACTGHVGKEPKLYGQNQNVMKFSVAVNRNQKKQPDGKWTGETDWFQCVLFRHDPKIVKGTALKIFGRWQNNNWQDKDGTQHWDQQVIIDMYQIFQPKDKKLEQQSQYPGVPPVADFPDDDASTPDFPDEDDNGDGIPF